MSSVSVVIPVKNAGRIFERVLEGVRRQGDLELIVVDSGSSDGSRELARDAGATVIEIAPREFGHGRTRNMAAARSSGELICFLTQDAIPLDGWLAAHREAIALHARVGAVFGPHLPHPDTSPMIARELTEFFAGFAPDGRPTLQRAGDLTFLSNVNACYRRECWSELRFPDVEYAEDQAFGAAMLEAGWLKAYHPGAAVLHAHDYRPMEFMQRYFDEYRGLREASGHVEPVRPMDAVRQVRRDARWMAQHGTERRGHWIARSVMHQGGRRVASALGSRASALPGPVQRLLSLESRGAPMPTPPASDGEPVPRGPTIPAGREYYDAVLRLAREGPEPLAEVPSGTADRAALRVAIVIPPFMRGSGGHNTIFTLTSLLESAGHTCSIWLYDALGHAQEEPAVLRRRVVEEFVPVRAPVFKGFDNWYGADVAVATGWDTAFPTMLLPDCRARAYLINDHEPEFFGTSAERLWAAQTYGLGLYGISASRWLRDLLAREYGQRGTWFRLGVDGRVYRPRPVERRPDTVIFYARSATPRRAVPLGLVALQELARRRPHTRFVLFGQAEPLDAGFTYETLGVASPELLAWHYSQATVGLCLSLTNYSLIPQEMMACGLPCVDVRGGSSEAEFGADGPVELSESDPIAIADAIDGLLGDDARRRTRSAAGMAFVESASWEGAARQVEAGLREALRERER